MKGQKAENRAVAWLRRSDARVEQSPGSRSSADGIAIWDTGKKWYYQVKYSGKGEPAGPSSHERRNLVARSRRNNGTPVVIKVRPNKIEAISAKTGRKLKP